MSDAKMSEMWDRFNVSLLTLVFAISGTEQRAFSNTCVFDGFCIHSLEGEKILHFLYQDACGLRFHDKKLRKNFTITEVICHEGFEKPLDRVFVKSDFQNSD